ncbi:MAG: tetratricopeptide repeat protein [Sodalinema sp.]|uniref:tetratricopeptide repeat protein n=1 Tax=Sodalinema sp. TaxID=3080550 RepID=UPI00396F3A38
MAKRKKKKAATIKKSRGFGKKSLGVELHRVQAYAVKEDWQGAYEVLQLLVEQYPQDKRVWEYLADVSDELRDLQSYQRASEKILEFSPNDADALYALGTIYMSKVHPLLASQMMQRALAIAPDHEYAPQAQEVLSNLTPKLPGLLEEMGLDDIEVAILHERGQACLGQGDYAAAREAELEVIRRHPEFISAHNNLALVSWAEGQVEDAIATSEAVLDSHPENIHALSNLVHFLVVSGDTETAQVYGDRLKTTQAEAWDPWTKRIEGLSYLADDAGIVEILDQAEAHDVETSPVGALFFHLTAVALARTGDETRALKQWKKALKHEPNMTVKDNLSDIRRPVGERHGAWPFSWEQWLLPTTARDLYDTLEGFKDNPEGDNTKVLMGQLFQRHSEFSTKLPRIMERGGPRGQEFGLIMAEQLQTPEILAIIKDFALGQNGSDSMRNRAASIATQAGLIPKDRVTLWIQGEWRDVMVASYEVSPEPAIDHPKPVKKLLNQAVRNLRQGDEAAAIEAERLLKQALKLETNAPDIYNNLAMAYILQGRQAEADTLMDESFERFPDYLFARCAKARRYLDEGDLDAAEALLTPVLSRDRFHTSEFNAFADIYISLLVEQDKLDKARGWLQMWDGIGSDHPRLPHWKKRLAQP